MNMYRNRTKKLLWSTLYSLITEKKYAFDSITINQLCEKALLHRTTFYKHFDDKYALLQYGYRSLTHERKKSPIKKRLLEPFSLSEQLNQTSSFHTAFELANTTPYLRHFFQKLMYEAIETDLKEVDGVYSTLPEKLIIYQMRSTLTTLDYYWRREASQWEAQMIDQLYQQMLTPYFQLEKFS